MREITQTILGNDLAELGSDKVPGNCVQACVAAVLDLPLDAVPHFVLFVWWDHALRLWLRGLGLDHTTTAAPKGESIAIPDGWSLVGGPSPRLANGQHMCVAYDGEIVWDPHPSRDGLPSVADYLVIHEWHHGTTEDPQ